MISMSSQSINFRFRIHTSFLFRENMLCGSAEETTSPVPWHQVGRSKCIVGWPLAGCIRASAFFFVSFLFSQPSFASLNTHFGLVLFLSVRIGSYGECVVWVDSKKGRRPPLRLFASWLGSPFAALPRSGQHHPSAPPAQQPNATLRASGTSQAVAGA